MWNAGLGESPAGIKIAGRNINNFRYADETSLMAEGKEEDKAIYRHLAYLTYMHSTSCKMPG